MRASVGRMSRLGIGDTGGPRATGSAPKPASRTDFYPQLEALRGVAALGVAAMHAWQSTWLDPSGQTRNFLSSTQSDSLVEIALAWILRVVGNGHGAVILFFVLSGFVLTGSLVRGPQDIARGTSRFVASRLFRLYPAVFVTIAIFALVFWTTGASISEPDSYSTLNLFKNALLLETSINGVMWTLKLELIAVPLLLLAYALFSRFGISALVALFGVLAALSFWGAWNRAIGNPNAFGSIHAFVLGMIAFLTAPRLVSRCTPRMATWTFIGAAAGFVASRPVIGWWSHWAVLAEAAFGAVAVAILAFSRPGAIVAIFDCRALRFFGQISYSFYLLHPLTLSVMWKIPALLGVVIMAGVPPVAAAIVLFIISVAVVTPFALAMYRWVERPGIDANRKLSQLISRDFVGRSLTAQAHRQCEPSPSEPTMASS
jgi:peptidoglycan/LPS O-acetylase OafA/YrhL